MKGSKFIFVGILATGALLFTGCTAKESKLICTQTANGVDVTFNVGFKGNLIQTMDFRYDMDLSKYSDLQIEAIGKSDFCTSVKNSMTDYKDAFMNCEHTIENKKLKLTAELEVNKIAKTVMSKMTTPEKGKEGLEAAGYTCTIEK